MIKKHPQKAGIYFIYSNGNLIYIGQSKNILKRLYNSNKMKYVNNHYDNISFKFELCNNPQKRLLKEKKYIKFYQPFLNRKSRELNLRPGFRQLHLYSDDKEWEEITSGIDNECNTESGKLRSGDVLKNILLSFLRELK